MSRARLMVMLLIVSFLLCLAANAAVAGMYTFSAEDEAVTVDYQGDPYFGDGRCRWTIDLWNSGLQQRMYQGQKQVFVKEVELDGYGSATGEWYQGGQPHFGTAYPSAYIKDLNTSLGNLHVYTPRSRQFNGGDGQWISSSLICEAKPDHNSYPGFDVDSSDIEINIVGVFD